MPQPVQDPVSTCGPPAPVDIAPVGQAFAHREQSVPASQRPAARVATGRPIGLVSVNSDRRERAIPVLGPSTRGSAGLKFCTRASAAPIVAPASESTRWPSASGTGTRSTTSMAPRKAPPRRAWAAISAWKEGPAPHATTTRLAVLDRTPAVTRRGSRHSSPGTLTNAWPGRLPSAPLRAVRSIRAGPEARSAQRRTALASPDGAVSDPGGRSPPIPQPGPCV